MDDGRSLRRMAVAAVALGAALFAGSAAAQAATIGILGGGPVYKHNPVNLRELRNAGFTELLVWSVEVNAAGDLNLNGEFPLTANGAYIGDQTWPKFARDLANIKTGTVTRITLSIGSSNFGDFQNINAPVGSQGTGRESILYKEFAALAAALPR